MTRTALPSPQYRWAILGVATFTQASSGFFVQGLGATGIHLQRALDLTTTQLGLLLSAAQFVPLIGLLVAGELLDRYNERWIVGAGACVVAAGLGFGSLASGYVSLLLALLIVGTGYSTAQPGGSKAVASWFDTSQRGFAMGIRQAGLPLSGMFAAAVLPFLAEAFDWRATLATGAIVALLGAGAFMGLYRPAPSGRERRSPPSGLRVRLLKEPFMIRIMMSGTSLIAVQSGVVVLTVLYLTETTRIGAGPAALVLMMAQAAGAAGRIGLAMLSDRARSGRYASIRICLMAVIVAMIAMMTPFGQSPVIAGALFIGLGFFAYGWYSPWVAHVAESAPPDKTGFALGLAMAVNQITVILIPPALGLLKDLTGTFTPAWALLTLMAAVTLISSRR